MRGSRHLMRYSATQADGMAGQSRLPKPSGQYGLTETRAEGRTRAMIVVDASVIVAALGDDGDDGDRVRARLRGESLAAPSLIDLEVVSAWRRILNDDRRAEHAIKDLERLRMTRAPHLGLVNRCWELRHSLTPYDASYVALAELLSAVLLTADEKLANAHGPRCEIELIS